jgi:hypothetical protein
MIINKSVALRNMEATKSDGSRISFSLEFITANRDNYRKYKALLSQMQSINTSDPHYFEIKQKLQDLDIGGKLINHDQCVLSRPRGKNAKTEMQYKKKQNHSSNRTRNIALLPGNNIRKIHNALIISFNGHEVLY